MSGRYGDTARARVLLAGLHAISALNLPALSHHSGRDGPQFAGIPERVPVSDDHKLHYKNTGTGTCGCGRTISRNKSECMACSLL